MTTLAIETASGSCGAALADESGLIASFELRAGRRHAELLHGVIKSLLDAAGVDFGDLDCIAVDIGPGLFTGIRVGVAAAKGYAMALGLPVVALTSLQILAFACEAAGADIAIGVVDLRRGEVAWTSPAGSDSPQVLRHGAPDLLATEVAEYLVAARAAPASAGSGRIVLAGDGARRYGEVLTAGHGGKVTVAGPELMDPPVSSLAVRGVFERAAGRVLDPLEVRPTYLRDADVRISWTTRHDAPGRPEARA
jgi:tRNA threonylcarbamoyladenosine biosynthesis protein TsaB